MRTLAVNDQLLIHSLDGSAGVREIHGTFKRSMPSAMRYTNTHMSFRTGSCSSLTPGGSAAAGGSSDEWSRLVTDAEAVRRVRQRLAALGGMAVAV